jgi:hypothetical protein
MQNVVLYTQIQQQNNTISSFFYIGHDCCYARKLLSLKYKHIGTMLYAIPQDRVIIMISVYQSSKGIK